MLTDLYRFLSIDVWGGLPAPMQRGISRLYTSIYNQPWSKLIIEPYCQHHYGGVSYLDQFVPASGGAHYENFQDFFSRQLKEPLNQFEVEAIWPAEGLLCDYGRVDELGLIKIKGEKRHIRTIFGEVDEEIPDDYYFTNVFLHNNNYHRIHAPISGKITRIEKIDGDLVLLRPWVYKEDPSLPALRNERVNLDIQDDQDRLWHLSIVGGPAVGTIVLPDNIIVGEEVSIGNEIAVFLLGSTCCMAAPIPLTSNQHGDQVKVGETL